jgi:hypothetical protein
MERRMSMKTLPHSARTRWLLPAGAVVAIVAIVVAVVVLVPTVRGVNDPAHPPVLHLVNVAGRSPGLPAEPAAGFADKTGAPGSRGSGWRLEGTLPDGPSFGRVHLLPAGAATRAFVGSLARALGMTGEPQHLKAGWYLVSGTTELSVSELAGRHWIYTNHGCIAGPVLDPQMGVACAVARSAPPIVVTPGASGAPGATGSPGGSDVTPIPTASPPVLASTPKPVREDLARNVARPVFQAVGINPDAARITTAGGRQSVVFTPEVAGSTVLGLETQVALDEQGQIVDASGWLAKATPGATYPLISAKQAYDELRAQPQPMMGLSMAPCRIVPGTSGCAPTPDRVVTGATLGLTQSYNTDRGVLLVPAWLFQVRDEDTSPAVVAVQRAFLGVPERPSPVGQPGTGSQPGSIGGAGGANGSTTETGVPTQVQPGAPAGAASTRPTG